MTILLDPQIYYHQDYGGISRYYTEIFEILNKKKESEIILPVFVSSNIYLNESNLINKIEKLKYFAIVLLFSFGIITPVKIKKASISKLRKSISRQKYHLFIPTYYDPYFLEYIGQKPFVLTVYDMIHEIFPHYFKYDVATVKNKLLLMEKATKIIAVSENTKKDILRIYPQIDSSKIEVIYHGCSISVNENLQLNLPSKYILFVGSRLIYKNFILLVNSLKCTLLKDTDLFLVCAGGGEFSEEENHLIVQLGLRDKIVYRNFQEEELGGYYKNAICFVFPSLYEGFGLPILESMACGCPIVLSNSSAFPEVAGQAGIYFENNNSEDLKEKVERVINDVDFRNDFKRKGLLQVQKFTWSEMAEKCYDLYKRAIIDHNNERK